MSEEPNFTKEARTIIENCYSEVKPAQKWEISTGVDDITILVEDDKCDVMEELENVLSRYYEIGVRLHLPDDKLKAIKKISSDAEAMNEVIVEWLKKNYNSNRFGSPTWKALVDAVGSPSGGNNKAEAEKIASKHRTASATINEKNTATIKGEFADLITKILGKLKLKKIDNDILLDLGYFIPKTAGIVEILEFLRRNSYMNISPLEAIISHFGSDDTQLNMWMKKYKESLAEHLATTKIVKYIDECKDDAELADSEADDSIARYDKQYCRKLSIKLKEQVMEERLEYIDQLWRFIAGFCLLPSPSYLIENIYIGSLVVVLLIPTKFAMQIRKSSRELASLLQKRDVISIMIEDEIIYQEGTTTMASDEEARKIIEYCSKRVQWLTSHSIDALVDNCRTVRENLDQIHKKKHLIINDPIHGTIKLNSLEKAMINTPEFYRLRDIKQLGPLFHVYPGATHSRFEHSIGVCFVAGELMEHLKGEMVEANGNKDNGNEILKEEHIICVRLAALCQDLGHGPFSHVFKNKDLIKKIIKPKEDSIECKELSCLIFNEILLDSSVVLGYFGAYGLGLTHVKMIESMITGKPKDTDMVFFGNENKCYLKFIYEIVSNNKSGMDVNKWDYFARDCYYLGLTNEFDWRRSMALSRIVKVNDQLHIGFRDKEVNNIYGMFRTRSVLHQKAFQHPVGNGIDLMLKDILLLVKDVKMILPKGDMQQISLKEAVERAFKKPADLTGYLVLSDGILSLITHAPVEAAGNKKQQEDLKKAQQLIRRIHQRDLYVKIDEKTYLDTEKMSKEQYDKLKEWKGENFVCYCGAPDMDIQQVRITHAEEEPDPVKKMHFFEKETTVDGFIEGVDYKAIKGMISMMNIPRAFMEHKVRLYSTKKGNDEQEVKKHFKTLLLQLTSNILFST